MLFLSGFMSKDLENFLMSAVKTNDSVTSSDEDRVLLFIMRMGISYAREIADSLMLNKDFIYKILKGLENDKRIIRIAPDRYYPQEIIKHRIINMWDKNIKSFEGFCNMSWFCISERELLSIAKRFIGLGKRVHYNYFKEYPSIKRLYDLFMDLPLEYKELEGLGNIQIKKSFKDE